MVPCANRKPGASIPLNETATGDCRTMGLDLPTMLWVMTVASAVLALAVLLADVRVREGDGIGLWGWGLLASSVSYPAFALRYVQMAGLSIVMTNTLLAVTVALHTAAVLQFRERPLLGWTKSALWGTVLLTAGFAVIMVDSHRTRNAMLTAVLAGQAAWLATLAWRPAASLAREHGRLLLVLGSTLLALVLVARTLMITRDAAWAADQTVSPDIQSTSYLFSLAVVLLNTTGFLLMHKERALARERAAAIRDALTGALLRGPLMEALEQGLSYAMRHREPYAVLMLDLDRFKRVNDEHGHLAGDAVLREAVLRIGKRLRRHDVLGRYGGEEFLVLLPGTDLAGARTVAEEIRRAIEEQPFVHDAAHIPVTVSVGVRALDGDAPPTALPGTGLAQAIVADSDRALYAAKHNGRNRVEVAA
jgi:diguanylate cyclase (GGDEF)-like protein